MKKQRGITLIALVITIIVLLILAGVSISMVAGDNGIARKALEAKEKTNAANDDEEKKLQDATDYIDEYVSGESATSFASQIDESNYGDYVDYGIDLGITSAGQTLSDGEIPKADWRIFYEDGENVYLIASDYLPASKFPSGVFGANYGKYNGYWSTGDYLLPASKFSSGVFGANYGEYNGYWSASDSVLTTSGTVTGNTKFLFNKLANVTKGNINYQAVSTLLDTTKWKVFAKEGYVDNIETAVIGSPTVEMWMSSWNKIYNDTLSFDVNTTGYQVGLTENSLNSSISSSDMQAKEGFSNTLYYPHGNTSGLAWNSCYGYRLASPSAVDADRVLDVYCSGSVSSDFYSNYGFGVRPVVSLKSNISASKNGDIWQLGN